MGVIWEYNRINNVDYLESEVLCEGFWVTVLVRKTHESHVLDAAHQKHITTSIQYPTNIKK